MTLTTTDAAKLNDCLNAVAPLMNAIEATKRENDEIYNKWITAHEFWKQERNKYNILHQEWKQRTGDFTRYADYEATNERTSDECEKRSTAGICTAYLGLNHDKCKEKFGLDYIDGGGRKGCGFGFWDSCAGSTGDNYSRGQYRICRRDPEVIARMGREYAALEPILSPEPIYGRGEFELKPSPIENSTISISCCSNTTNLSGNIDAHDNIQSCTQQIQQELQKQIQNPQSQDRDSNQTTTDHTNDPPNGRKEYTNNKIIWGIVVAIVCCILFLLFITILVIL